MQTDYWNATPTAQRMIKRRIVELLSSGMKRPEVMVKVSVEWRLHRTRGLQALVSKLGNRLDEILK